MNAFQQYFLDPVTKRYFDFTGRSRRRDFWMYTLFATVISLVAGIIDGLLGMKIGADESVGGGFGVVQLILALALFLPGLGLTARRLHDTGRSGWWILIALVPFIGAVVLFVFEVLDSQPVENKWGPDPKAGERVAAFGQ